MSPGERLVNDGHAYPFAGETVAGLPGIKSMDKTVAKAVANINFCSQIAAA